MVYQMQAKIHLRRYVNQTLLRINMAESGNFRQVFIKVSCVKKISDGFSADSKSQINGRTDGRNLRITRSILLCKEPLNVPFSYFMINQAHQTLNLHS
jgi:hypothetical protein